MSTLRKLADQELPTWARVNSPDLSFEPPVLVPSYANTHGRQNQQKGNNSTITLYRNMDEVPNQVGRINSHGDSMKSSLLIGSSLRSTDSEDYRSFQRYKKMPKYNLAQFRISDECQALQDIRQQIAKEDCNKECFIPGQTHTIESEEPLTAYTKPIGRMTEPLSELICDSVNLTQQKESYKCLKQRLKETVIKEEEQRDELQKMAKMKKQIMFFTINNQQLYEQGQKALSERDAALKQVQQLEVKVTDLTEQMNTIKKDYEQIQHKMQKLQAQLRKKEHEHSKQIAEMMKEYHSEIRLLEKLIKSRKGKQKADQYTSSTVAAQTSTPATTQLQRKHVDLSETKDVKEKVSTGELFVREESKNKQAIESHTPINNKDCRSLDLLSAGQGMNNLKTERIEFKQSIQFVRPFSRSTTRNQSQQKLRKSTDLIEEMQRVVKKMALQRNRSQSVIKKQDSRNLSRSQSNKRVASTISARQPPSKSKTTASAFGCQMGYSEATGYSRVSTIIPDSSTSLAAKLDFVKSKHGKDLYSYNERRKGVR